MAKPKKVNVERVADEDADGNRASMYAMLDGLVAAHHPHLAQARIALAWNYSWGEDADGQITLGRARKVSDLERDLHGYDLIILLNRPAWDSLQPEQRTALVDHELCHFEVAKDKEGEERVDDRGRAVYRLRKHDIGEFREVVSRNGMWKADIEQFVRSIKEKKSDGPGTPAV